MILQTPQGPSLWRHNALCFGASGSVWCFNRFADLLQFLARRLLWCPVHHYVDDFASVEDVSLAASGFYSFADLFGSLGLQMKPKKALYPSSSQKLLGVIIEVNDTDVVVRPSEWMGLCDAPPQPDFLCTRGHSTLCAGTFWTS